MKKIHDEKWAAVQRGVWRSKKDPGIRIIIERVYKKKETVDYFFFMCKLTGGGTINKDQLLQEYEREQK